MQDNYSLLIKKLDGFIRKYYTNKLIRGIIYFLALVVALFIAINVAEYYMYFSSGLRKALFFGFIGVSALSLVGWVIIPLLKINKLGKVISNQQAAEIIGRHFGNVQDKLLNVLQLNEAKGQVADASLINASISQKVGELKPVPFSKAINLGDNKKYLKYLVPPVLLFVAILFINASIFKDGSERLINSDTFYEKEMPFSFNIDEDNLRAIQYEDYTLDLEMKGEVLPEDVYINVDGVQYKMPKESATNYKYEFVNLQKAQNFYFSASGFRSKDYELYVIPKPLIVSFDVSLDYPNYIGKQDEVLKSIGDLSIPNGTKVTWRFNTQSIDDIIMQFGDSSYNANRGGEALFNYMCTFYKSQQYSIQVSNKELEDAEAINYAINVIPDQYPAITVEEFEDSTNSDFLYFLGEISDDYGLNALVFSHQIEYVDSSNKKSNTKKEKLPIGGQNFSQFSHYIDVKAMGLNPGDKLTYYFEVFDNDGVNGSKRTRSNMMVYEMPTIKELEEQTDKNNEEIKDELEETIEESAELKKEMQELREKLLQKKNMNWEDKKALEDLMKKQKNLQKKLDELEKKLDKNFEKQNEFKEPNEDIQKKQEALEKLMEEVMSDEMKELMEKLEKLMEEMSKDEVMKELEEMEFNDEQVEKELDRMLELFKQLEMEQKVEETVEKLEELAKEQEELAEETKNSKKEDQEKLAEKQEEINEKLEDIEKEMEKIDEMNEELDSDMDMEEMQEKMEEAQSETQEAKDQLQKGNKSKSSESQQDASDKMEEMAEEMSDMMQQSQAETMEEDYESLRQLLENLVTLSFEQEKLMDEIKVTNINNPKYVELVQQQFKIRDDSKMVEDSLYALAKRVFQIESFITKQITEINQNLDKAIKNLEERKKGEAAKRQQYVMTGYNNLALMLSEVMEQMQQQMAQQSQSNAQCNKPKDGKPKGSCKKLGNMQKELNDQISKMGKELKSGKKPGDMNKQLAKMAQKQRAIREALQEINQSENSDGKNSLGDLEKIMEEMEQTETDLVNKQLTEELLNRQKDITIRLLEAADAEKQRDLDEKRESKTADQIVREVPPSLEEYLKKRESEVDFYKTVPPSLKPFYRSMVEKYFKTLTY